MVSVVYFLHFPAASVTRVVVSGAVGGGARASGSSNEEDQSFCSARLRPVLLHCAHITLLRELSVGADVVCGSLLHMANRAMCAPPQGNETPQNINFNPACSIRGAPIFSRGVFATENRRSKTFSAEAYTRRDRCSVRETWKSRTAKFPSRNALRSSSYWAPTKRAETKALRTLALE